MESTIKFPKEPFIMKYLFFALLIGITSCSGGNRKTEKMPVVDNESNTVSIQGQWDIENVVENDSTYIRPSEMQPGINAYIDFKKDNTFGVMTNCNHIAGQYHQEADSILLTEISTTELACDNMALEEMLKKILPIINTIDCINDSITRLNSTKGDTYIVLKKRGISVK